MKRESHHKREGDFKAAQGKRDAVKRQNKGCEGEDYQSKLKTGNNSLEVLESKWYI